eukprot:TRINITY_DN3158_c0_g1_i2.p2 TRINITY_DN3158_c0_g1~~TRINITY_DN3158_c0_g1_i2.p2  ORF type:complete len:120 (-),score=23.74 TRINITY_DN3158_c0_g1_i2:162-521(-)
MVDLVWPGGGETLVERVACYDWLGRKELFFLYNCRTFLWSRGGADRREERRGEERESRNHSSHPAVFFVPPNERQGGVIMNSSLTERQQSSKRDVVCPSSRVDTHPGRERERERERSVK